mmetsp:Transcript_12615/g.19405  ORF Transcript_12615/g.19405 Transcript_12615/m.19405 type:complete len:251 (-) Transcript_12615:604-1356(-)
MHSVHVLLDGLQRLSKPTITITDTGKNSILSRGDTATLPKKKRNTQPVPEPDAFGEVCHYDIIYGDGRAIGGINYALLIVCRKTNYIFLHGLQDLEKDSIKTAMLDFMLNIGRHLHPPTQVSRAPSGRQSQNGRSETNYRHLCTLSRNWLADHYLPTEFWFFAMSNTVQVHKYLPFTTSSGETNTTPFFDAFSTPPDLPKLIPLFSVAYVKKHPLALQYQGNQSSSKGRKICHQIPQRKLQKRHSFQQPK